MSALNDLLDAMQPYVDGRGLSDREWAIEAGVRPETLSRLRSKGNCDFSTVQALARVAGVRLVVADDPQAAVDAQPTIRNMPAKCGRDEEEVLLNLCADDDLDPDRWLAAGPSFFMGGLAVMLASAHGYDRARYLAFAEALHPGIGTPEVFSMWLRQSPARPSRFLPMLQKRRGKAA